LVILIISSVKVVRLLVSFIFTDLFLSGNMGAFW
jgi:hypothetical protein